MIVWQVGSQGDGNPTELKKVEQFYKFSKHLSHA